MLHQESENNVRRAWLVLSGFVLVLLVIGAGLGALFGSTVVGVIVGAAIALAMGMAAYLAGDRIVLRLSRARNASLQDQPRLHNILDGLAATAGLPRPAAYVVDDDAPNAFATGRDPARASIVVTRGMLDMMNRVELEAVIAHELAHVKNRDTLSTELAVALVGSAATLLPFIGPLLQAAAGRRREFYADLTGVQLTRYPPGLISALEKLKARPGIVRDAPRATEPVWFDSPLPAGGMNRFFDTHPPLDERIKVLREL